MMINWKYKIELANKAVFAEIEQERNITIPKELKDIVIAGNAATPEKCNFIVGFTEHCVGAVLSFNRAEKDTDTVFTALEVIEDKNFMPFAIDPFGNYICLDLLKNEVVFWNHELDVFEGTGDTLTDFFDKLY